MRRLVVIIAVTLSVATAFAQPTDDERFKEAQRKLEARLKAAATKPSGVPAARAAVPSAAELATRPAATQGAAPAPKGPLTFEQVLKQLPEDARPHPKRGWDEFAAPAAQKWLAANLKGKELLTTVELGRVELEKIPDPKNEDKAIGWNLTAYFGQQRIDLYDRQNYVYVTALAPGATQAGETDVVHLRVSEAVAKQSRDWERRDVLQLAGRVHDVKVVAGSGPSDTGNFVVVYQDVRIVGVTKAKAW